MQRFNKKKKNNKKYLLEHKNICILKIVLILHSLLENYKTIKIWNNYKKNNTGNYKKGWRYRMQTYSREKNKN